MELRLCQANVAGLREQLRIALGTATELQAELLRGRQQWQRTQEELAACQKDRDRLEAELSAARCVIWVHALR